MVATEFHWTSASRTDVGLVRKINEDACLDQPGRRLWAVADGMGGHTLGDYASRKVVETLGQIPVGDTLLQFIADARESLQTVNRELRAEATRRDVRIIGSTVVVLLACERSCGYLWAGDSRIYLYRSGRLKLLTRDHSQVQEFANGGSENGALRPARNLITRAVGAIDTLDLDEETMEVQDDDMFLLCSDGLSNLVSEQDMRNALICGDCRQASEALIDMALTQGGRDNISAVVVRAEDPGNVDQTVLNPAL